MAIPETKTKYCPCCEERTVMERHDGAWVCTECGNDPDEYEAESGLRRMEAYAAYQAAGCTDGFWEDDTAQGGEW